MSLFKQIEALRQQRSEALAAGRQILESAQEEKRELTKDEDAKFDETHLIASEHRKSILRLQTQKREEELRFDEVEDLPAAGASPGATGTPAAATHEQRRLATLAWMREQRGMDNPPEALEAAKACGVNIRAPELKIDLATMAPTTEKELRAMSALDGTAGGILTGGGEFVPEYEKAMLHFGGVRQVADIVRTSHGNDIEWPGGDDTGNMGRRLNEAKTVTETNPTFKAFVLKAWKYSSDLIKAPSELLEDMALNVPAMIGELLGERIGRKTNLDFTLGADANGPQGIVTGSVLGKTAASATAIIPEELIDLVHSVDKAYRNGANAGWMLNDLIIAAIRKLKGTDAYFFQPSFQDGEPDRLLNYPYTINNDMDGTITATSKVALFGALGKYKVRDVNSIRLRRLTERYAEDDVEGFVAFARHDGGLFDAGGNPIKHLITAA